MHSWSSSSSSSDSDEPRMSDREKSAAATQLRIDQALLARPPSSTPRPPSSTPPPSRTPSSPSSPSALRTTTVAPAYRFTSQSRLCILSSILFSFFALLVILDSFTHHQRDVNGCKESYMRPSYIRQTGFDSEMTRFAGKYALYLYREKDVDVSDQPTGIPVLFIPGHAGSYKQIRSVAAETSFYYYQHYARHPELAELGMRNLDFFTVDFHEEFSALHGQSLLEQAEYLNDAVDYILKLYPLSRKSNPRMNAKLPDPTSVIIVGHSMGGVVARTMFMLSNYQPGSINTIITMSTPHSLPPAPFDWKISKIYDDMHRFWIDGFNSAVESDWPRSHSLKDVMLISIAGGTLDNIVCSDSANVGAFLPPTNGFTVFTTAIPHVWTGTDHLSIISCKQLMRVLAKSMLNIVDARRPSQTKPLSERMQVMQKAFLSGLEDRAGDGSDLALGEFVHFDLAQHNHKILARGERLVLTEPASTLSISLLPTFGGPNAFAILSDQPITNDSRFSLFLCSSAKSTEASYISCRSANNIAIAIPASTTKDEHAFSGRTFTFASIEFDEMKDHDWLAVMDRGGSEGFLIAEPFNMRVNSLTVDKSMLTIALEGVHLDIDASLFSSVRIPAIENPMLAYHLKVSRPSCPSSDSIFAPFLRQSISTMYESKFYVNLAGDDEETDLSLHGRAAFSSMPVSLQNSGDHRGLALQLWMDPTCMAPVRLSLTIDWYGSAGRLGFRNGIMLAAFAFIVVILVLAAQIQCYNQTGIFPHFGQGLSYCMRRTLPVVTVIVAISSIYQCTTHADTVSSPLKFNISIAWHDILAGNTDPFFWWLPLAGLTMSTGTVCFLWVTVELLLHVCAAFVSLFAGKGSKLWRSGSRPNETRGQKFQRKAITTLILFALVTTCIPYQFVFVVAFIVHIVTCIRALLRTWAAPSEERKRMNRYHYLQSLLILFITLLPFNLPILVVWIRNLSVHWLVPFSSDHNVFAIAPFILYVELLTSTRKMLPQTQGLWSMATYALMYAQVVYAFMYSIKYTHSLYFLSNYLIFWYMILHIRESHRFCLLTRYVLEHIHSFRSKKHS